MSPWLTVYLGYSGDRALVRGRDAMQVSRAVAGSAIQWSQRGTGWLIAGDLTEDVAAYCQVHNIVLTITDKRPRWERAK